MIQSEIERCDVVCVNCHRRRTFERLHTCWRLDTASIDSNAMMTPAHRRNLAYVRDFLLKSECLDCGFTDLVALEFDHRGDKVGDVTVMSRNCSLERLIDEIAKCDVRCANCHRRRTILARREERDRERDGVLPRDFTGQANAPGRTRTDDNTE